VPVLAPVSVRRPPPPRRSRTFRRRHDLR
jgi:hypothetical protein